MFIFKIFLNISYANIFLYHQIAVLPKSLNEHYQTWMTIRASQKFFNETILPSLKCLTEVNQTQLPFAEKGSYRNLPGSPPAHLAVAGVPELPQSEAPWQLRHAGCPRAGDPRLPGSTTPWQPHHGKAV